jgi:hypothetical protein
VVTGAAIEPITVYVCSCYAPGVVFVLSTTVGIFTGVTITTPVTITNINCPTNVGAITVATTIYQNGTTLTTVVQTTTVGNTAQRTGQIDTTGTNPTQQAGQRQRQTTTVTIIELTSTSAGMLPQVNTEFSGLGAHNIPITFFSGFGIFGLFALLV